MPAAGALHSSGVRNPPAAEGTPIPPRRHCKTHRHESAMIYRERAQAAGLCRHSSARRHRRAGAPVRSGTIASVMSRRCCKASPIL
ncbi:MAG: hypothetical protein KME26_14700 [Oscillatoria princeps RMCB-10]|nr:hypothetical protein [Oscillatoria princeps RMCB-10]